MSSSNMPWSESTMTSKPGVAGKGKRVVAAGILGKKAAAKKDDKKKVVPFWLKKKAAGSLKKSCKK